MKSQAITILSIVGVLGTGVAAMAVNSDVLSSAVQSPVGKTSESLLLTPTGAPTDTATPGPSATEIPRPTDLATPGEADDSSATPGSDDRDKVEPSAQPSTRSSETGTGSDDAPRPAATPTSTPHVEDVDSHETETHETGETHEKDD